MSITLEDSVDLLILEGKSYSDIKFTIESKWHKNSINPGIRILNKKFPLDRLTDKEINDQASWLREKLGIPQ